MINPILASPHSSPFRLTLRWKYADPFRLIPHWTRLSLDGKTPDTFYFENLPPMKIAA